MKAYAHQLVEIAVQLSAQAVLLGQLSIAGTTEETVPPTCIDEIRRHLNAAKPLCEELGMRGPLIQVDRLLGELEYHNVTTLAMSVRETHSRITDELSGIYFIHVPCQRVGFYDGPWCGTKVEEAFPSAVRDIREAGNCFALGRWSAAVFHCMGIIQCGLYVLADDLKVEFKSGIELENWKNIIDKIQSKIDERLKEIEQKEPKGIPKDETLAFYSRVASQFQYFRLAWRNHVAHLRESYDDMTAATVLSHVGVFMERLSERLSEPK